MNHSAGKALVEKACQGSPSPEGVGGRMSCWRSTASQRPGGPGTQCSGGRNACWPLTYCTPSSHPRLVLLAPFSLQQSWPTAPLLPLGLLLLLGSSVLTVLKGTWALAPCGRGSTCTLGDGRP